MLSETGGLGHLCSMAIITKPRIHNNVISFFVLGGAALFSVLTVALFIHKKKKLSSKSHLNFESDDQTSKANISRISTSKSSHRYSENLIPGLIIGGNVTWLEENNLIGFWYKFQLENKQEKFMLFLKQKNSNNQGILNDLMNHEMLANALNNSSMFSSRQYLPHCIPICDMEVKILSKLNLEEEDERGSCLVELSFRVEGVHCLWRDNAGLTIQEGVSQVLTPGSNAHKRTIHTGEPVHLQIHNRSKAEMFVYWLSSEGRLHPCGIVEPKQGVLNQNTYVGHVWLLSSIQLDDNVALSRLNPSGLWKACFETPTFGGSVYVDDEFVMKAKEETEREENEKVIQMNERREKEYDWLQSPDGLWGACVADENMLVMNMKTGTVQSIGSADGKAVFTDKGLTWAPDSQTIAVIKVECPDQLSTLSLVESWPNQNTMPRYTTRPYPRPGDQVNKPQIILFRVPQSSGITTVEGAESMQPDEDDKRDWTVIKVLGKFFPSPLPNSAYWLHQDNFKGPDLDLEWGPQSEASGRTEFLFLDYVSRSKKVRRMIAISVLDGSESVLFEDTASQSTSTTLSAPLRHFVDSTCGKFWCVWLPDSWPYAMLYLSEASGYCHLYLTYRIEGGRWVSKQITHGDFVVFDVLRLIHHTPAQGGKVSILFKAGGVIAGQDPYFQHLCRIELGFIACPSEGAVHVEDLRVLTSVDGPSAKVDATHDVSLSPDGSCFVDIASRYQNKMSLFVIHP